MSTPGPRGRGATLMRALLLAKRIEHVRVLPSLEILAREFGVHVRTIRRDLYLLEHAGWPVPQFRYHASHVMEIRLFTPRVRPSKETPSYDSTDRPGCF